MKLCSQGAIRIEARIHKGVIMIHPIHQAIDCLVSANYYINEALKDFAKQGVNIAEDSSVDEFIEAIKNILESLEAYGLKVKF